MEGEDLLHTDAVRDAADGKALLDAAVLLGDDGALEDLDSLPVALLHPLVDADRVAEGHLGRLGLCVLVSESFHQIHDSFPPVV